jgi:adenylate cyclase
MTVSQNASPLPISELYSHVVSLRIGHLTELSPAHDSSDLPAQPACPDEHQIRAQLERIIASAMFDASLRNRAFLRYVVDQTLAGQANYIKGYSVAQEVFQRDVNFDPQLDPVVRIEARRLRRSLELYYLTVGKLDPVRIDLPKGGYVPTFFFNDRDRLQSDAEAFLDETRLPRQMSGAHFIADPFIIVRPFENLGDPSQDGIARGLADELIVRLLAYEGVAVVAEGIGSTPLLASGPHYRATQSRFAPPGRVLKGSMRRSADKIRIWAQLLDASNGRYLWVKGFDFVSDMSDISAVQEQIATSIVDAVAGSDGALFKAYSV